MIGLQDKIDAIGVAKELKNTEVKAALTDIHERKAWKQVYAKVGSPFGKKQGATVEWNRTTGSHRAVRLGWLKGSLDPTTT